MLVTRNAAIRLGLICALLWGCGGGAPASLGSDGGAVGDGSTPDGSTAGDGGAPFDAPDGAVACSTDKDCRAGFASCTPGGVQSGCGICVAPTCQVDADCKDAGASAMICESIQCACGAGGGQCFPACKTDIECGANSACGATGHCIAKSCTSDADCTGDYACGSSKTCVQKTCTSNADCGHDYCVNGACYPEPGYCAPFAA
jgi:hypothetical protein